MDSLQQGIHEALGLEGHQVFSLFAYADELDGNLQGIGDGDDDAALGSAIQLGQGDGGNASNLLRL